MMMGKSLPKIPVINPINICVKHLCANLDPNKIQNPSKTQIKHI